MSSARLLVGPAVLLVLAGCNQPPSAPEIALGPDAPTTTDDLELSFSAMAEDPDDDPLQTSITWQLDRGAGFADTGLTGRIVPNGETRKGDTWRATVVVSDGVETLEPVTAEVSVVNSPPRVSSLRITPTVVDTFGTISASVTTEDADGDPVAVELTWYVDGTALDTTESTLSGERFEARQEIVVEAVATDGEATSEPVRSRPVIVGNTTPSVQSARLEPQDPTAADDITCVPEGWFDADGDAAGYQIEWLVNGESVATGDRIGAALLSRDDLVRCSVIPDDGALQGDPVLSPGVVVQNTPPSIEGVTIDNASPVTGDQLTFSVSGAEDLDGDTVQPLAEWFVDGVQVATGTSLPPSSAVRGEQVTVRVTPTDGTDVGEAVTSAPVTIGNTAPVLTDVSIKPGTLYTDSSAFPTVAVEDVDGDPISYTVSWSVNGSVVSSAPVLEGTSAFDKGDTVTVEVTPTDGVDTGIALSSTTLTVENSVPTTPVVAITPADPDPGESLRCVIVEDSTDADPGDTLTRTLTWTRNGGSYSDATTTAFSGDTVPASDAIDKDEYVCTYSVFDGTETVIAEASVDVLLWKGQLEVNTCGAVGATGPSQSDCDASYRDELLDGKISVSGGFQTWTAPLTGSYRLTVAGAAGGAGTTSSASYDGYPGAEVSGVFDLTEGDELTFVVGQMGESLGTYGAGGGGGSFVFQGETLILAAGGGGGNGYSLYGPSGCEGQASESPRSGGNSSSTSACSSASTPEGEGAADYLRISDGSSYYEYYYGGGGAGLNSDGEAYRSGDNSQAIVDGARGGRGAYGDGGFGGGGTGGYVYWYRSSTGSEYGPYTSSFYGGGGGGGYTGGESGYYRGGGGTSFIASDATDTTAKSGANDSDGKIQIDYLD